VQNRDMDKGSDAFPTGGLAVVVGSSGGIGRALLGRLAAQPRFCAALGLGRSSSPHVDLTDEESIAQAARHVQGLGADVRLVIDATGFLHMDGFAPEKSWRDLDAARMARAFAVNAVGPALLMKHFLPLLPRQGRSVFATLSARVGSIGDNRLGGWYSYRASKAALNQFVHTAAIELGRRRPAALCVALHPGTAATPLSAPFVKAGLEVQTTEQAADHLLDTIERLRPGSSGGFFDHRGEMVPW
jgi:NAD(P)-dependent dehydrogenase (short-subunit alcohol dehydrogenase family)